MFRRLICAALVALTLPGVVCARAQERTMEMKLSGPMGERFEANLENWLLTAPYANPGMLQMYFRRDQAHQRLVPWYGEFSGKYLTTVALAYRMQPDERLKAVGDYVVEQLAKAQGADGYLGVWPESEKLAGRTQSGDKTWDAWGHYHNMMGLTLWHQATGSELAMEVVDRAVGCLYDFYITQGHKMDEDKDGTDTAVAHICALLYQQTGDERCLALVDKAYETFAAPLGGDYYNAGLKNRPFYQMKRTRWECLHAIQTIKASYDITGEADYKTAFENIWDGVMRYDRHNTGGFSSGERACGNPYDLGAIETCCTIAWMALSEDMLDLSDNPVVADELELSTWNALIGAQQNNGRSFTYNTPMIGDRKASAHEIVFQAIAGSPELNCCSVNGPRGLGMIGEWGVKVSGERITLNYYGASETEVETASGSKVRLTQSGAYPFGSDLRIELSASDDYRGDLRLRIPFWSEDTRVFLNGEAVDGVSAGSYLTLPGVKSGDVIELAMDMSLHFWQGNYELGGKTSLYVGPILLAYDQRFNGGAQENPTLRLSEVTLSPAQTGDTLWPAPNLLLECAAANGETVVLCDFASAGQTGTSYTTWLSTENELPILRESGDQILWGQRLATE